MIEHGLITQINGSTATVEIQPTSEEACGSCSSSCDAGQGSRKLEVEADPKMQVGSELTVEIPMPSPYLAISLLLLVPLAMLIGGVVLGSVVIGNDLAAFGLGLAGFAASYGLARFVEARARRRGLYRPAILSIQPPPDPDAS